MPGDINIINEKFEDENILEKEENNKLKKQVEDEFKKALEESGNEIIQKIEHNNKTQSCIEIKRNENNKYSISVSVFDDDPKKASETAKDIIFYLRKYF